MTQVIKPPLSSLIYNELNKTVDSENNVINYEYGTVISVKDGLLNVQAGELVEFVDSDVKGLVLNFRNQNKLFFNGFFIYIFLIILYILLLCGLFDIVCRKASSKSLEVVMGSDINLNRNIVFMVVNDSFGQIKMVLHGEECIKVIKTYYCSKYDHTSFHYSVIDNSLSHKDITSVGLSFTSSPIVPKTMIANQQIPLRSLKQICSVVSIENAFNMLRSIVNEAVLFNEKNLVLDLSKKSVVSLDNAVLNIISSVVIEKDTFHLGKFSDVYLARRIKLNEGSLSNIGDAKGRFFEKLNDFRTVENPLHGSGTLYNEFDINNSLFINNHCIFNIVNFEYERLGSIIIDSDLVLKDSGLNSKDIRGFNKELLVYSNFVNSDIGSAVLSHHSKHCVFNVYCISFDYLNTKKDFSTFIKNLIVSQAIEQGNFFVIKKQVEPLFDNKFESFDVIVNNKTFVLKKGVSKFYAFKEPFLDNRIETSGCNQEVSVQSLINKAVNPQSQVGLGNVVQNIINKIDI